MYTAYITLMHSSLLPRQRGYTDINRYQIQRGNYENKEKPLTIMYISETQHSRPS